MISRADLLSLEYYKSKPFKGSDRNMRYMIERQEADDEIRFNVVTWPGPLSYEATDEEKKTSHQEDFSDEGLSKIADYLNSVSPEYNFGF